MLGFDTIWVEVLLSTQEVPSGSILERFTKCGYGCLFNSRLFWHRTNKILIRRICHRATRESTTMVKNFLDQKVSARNFEARNERTVTEKQKQREFGQRRKEARETAINGKQMGSARKETHAVSPTMTVNVESQRAHTSPIPRTQTKGKGKSVSKGRSLRGVSPSGKRPRRPCKKYLSGNCTNPSCDSWNPPVSQNYKSKSGCKFGDNCVFLHRVADGQPSKRPKKGCGKGLCCPIDECKAVGFRNSGYRAAEIQHDFTEGPTILETQTPRAVHNVCVEPRKNSEKKGSIAGCNSAHSSSLYAPKFEERSQEETFKTRAMRPERCMGIGQDYFQAQGKAQNNILVAFGCLWCLLAPSSVKTRGKRVCRRLRGFNAHAERKDLNSAELKTVRVSRNHTTVITANEEVQTRERLSTSTIWTCS